jgi:hypothetical protein
MHGVSDCARLPVAKPFRREASGFVRDGPSSETLHRFGLSIEQRPRPFHHRKRTHPSQAGRNSATVPSRHPDEVANQRRSYFAL